jgi:hypothetical protein
MIQDIETGMKRPDEEVCDLNNWEAQHGLVDSDESD